MPLPFLLSLPHASRHVPIAIRSSMALSDREIGESEDFGTRELFSGIPVKRVLMAEMSRLVVDLNRPADRRDIKGVVALTDYHGRSVFHPHRIPSPKEIDARVDEYHHPYHRQISEALSMPGIIGIFDCHSLNGLGPSDAPDPNKPRREVTLGNNGDRNGHRRSETTPLSCPTDQFIALADAFDAAGFTVSLNHPYSGGYITTHYGADLSASGRFAVQLEMNQQLYMAPGALTPDPEAIKATGKRLLHVLKSTQRIVRQI